MRKSCFRSMATCFLVGLLLLGSISALADALPLMSISLGTAETGSEFTFSWGKWSGADYYEYSVRDTTTGDLIHNHKRTTGRNGRVKSSLMEYGHSLHIWVGAYEDDQLVAQVHADAYVKCGLHEYVNGVCACGDTCSHRWNSKTGVCKECDMECPHSDTYDKETKRVGVSISDTKHKSTITYNEICEECGMTVETGLTKVKTEKHVFDSNGDCTLCDYDVSCDHEDSTKVERTTSYEYLNDSEHRVKTVYDVVCANANCGKVLEYGGYITSDTEEHSFSSGVCQDCGFSVASPLTATVSRSASTISLGKTITGRCAASGGSGSYEYAWGGYCGSKKYFSQYYSSENFYTFTPSKVGTWKIHVYVRDKETGDKLSLYSAEFTVTEAVVECTHANYTDVSRSDKEYVKISDSKHKVVTKVDRVCDDCGEVINTTDKVETEAHTYSGGNCTRCGAAEPAPECAHSSMKSTELSRKLSKNSSTTEHVVVITWKDVCASCGVTLNTTRTTTQMEKHSYNDSGVCACGYVKPAPTCDHADTEKIFVSSSTAQHDASRHKVTTTYQVKCSCGVVVDEAHEEYAYFAHTWEGGKCAHCGYVQPATPTPAPVTPPPVTEAPVTPVPEDVVCTAHGAEHVYDYTGYEAAHPHKIFKRCDCGATYYTGGIRTANGAEQTQADCCLCHGHAWDSSSAQQKDGKWIETCGKCGFTREASYECEYHHGAHQYTEVLYAAKHPHVGKLACMCGAEDPEGTAQGTCSMPTCCDCGNHVWNPPFYHSGYGQYMQVCTRCVEQHLVQVELDDHITTKFSVGGDYDRTEAFDEIHSFACEANQNGVYVFVNETIEAGSNFSKAAYDTFKTLVTDDGEATEKAKIKEWEHIIANTLMDHLDANPSESIDMALFSELFSDEDLNSLYKYTNERGEKYTEYVAQLLNTKRAEAASGVQAYQRLAEMRGLSVQETIELGELQKQQDNLTKGMEDWNKASKTLKMIGIGASAFVELVKNEEQQQVFSDLANYSYECEKWLNEMMQAAEETGDDSIATAAENVLKRIEFEQENCFAGEWVSLVETGKKVGVDVITDSINSAIEKACPALAVISLCSDTAELALDWKDSYESSFRLMMLHEMMRNMETLHPSKDIFEESKYDMDVWFDVSMESGYIMAQLYTEVQKEGLTESKNYLKEYEDGSFLNVSKDFGISYDSKMRLLDSSINAAQQNHEMLKEFYANRDLWDVTAFELDFTEEELWNYDNVTKKDQMAQEDGEQYAKVISTAILRVDADPNSDYKITKHAGDVVKVLHFKNDWYYVEYDENCYGYIHSSRVESIPKIV